MTLTDELRAGLATIASVRRRGEGDRAPAWPYLTFEDFVLAHGRPWRYAPGLPPGVRKGRLRECFKNATDAILLGHAPGLVYVEGYATHDECPIPVHHGWLGDAAGNAYDPTWDAFLAPGERAYIGVPFARDFLAATAIKARHYGVIDRHELGFPLLTGKVKPEAAVAAWPPGGGDDAGEPARE